MIRYSREPAIKPGSRGVLDTRFRGYDDLARATQRATAANYFFFRTGFAFGSGFSACGSKPI